MFDLMGKTEATEDQIGKMVDQDLARAEVRGHCWSRLVPSSDDAAADKKLHPVTTGNAVIHGRWMKCNCPKLSD